MRDQDWAIRVENLGKLYRLGTQDRAEDNLVSAIVGALKSPLKNYRKYRSTYDFRDVEALGDDAIDAGDSGAFWALKDISFEVKRGEALGLIGSNGAGKSTLLKVLSRITPPTRGRAEIQGRLNSLLEVGTGFHPELTGRENVFLNGTILGMRRKEVEKKFDAIVDFSGVERFLDTPVKRYSSGMRVRLAFAVAAHLEPEVLIVDEVLAVGDAEFQRKCLDKMQEGGKSGQTVIFVSHSMPAISRLCDRVLLLKDGRVAMDGPTHDVVSAYLANERPNSAQKEWPDRATAPGGEIARLCAVRLMSEDGAVSDTFDIRRPVGVEIHYEVLKGGCSLMPTFSLWNDEGINICVAVDQDKQWRGRPRPPGHYVSTGWIPGNLLAEGVLSVNVTLWAMAPVRRVEFHETEVVAFQTLDTLDGDSARGDFQGNLPGLIRPMLRWTTAADTVRAANG
jgi:lipopolysaccharide transport system ATP-binding protein